MAISVDTVYQRVLTLANKEQRGYITPQEFNLLANQAQQSIFEGYFYELNRRDRTEEDRDPSVDETDLGELISKKLGSFLSVESVINGDTFPPTVTAGDENPAVFQTGRVFYNNQVCQKISINEAFRFTQSTRHIATTTGQGPVYTDNFVSNRDILVYAGSATPIASGVNVECFRNPIQVAWGYVVVNEKALYNSNTSVDFELHRGEEDTLVNQVLFLAGIVINKIGLANTAGAQTKAEQQIQSA
tara:strand:- start:310 stop:1044 length:735 start_codon:yes stop_codon:yes gene_type:complete